MKKGYVLSIGAGKSQVILINEIKQMGYKCVSCDLNNNAPGKKLSDIFINISTHEPQLIIEEILRLNIKIKAVLTRSTGVPVLTASIIAGKFGLKALKSSIAEILIDKSAFMKKMNYLGISSPTFYEYKENMEIKNITFPVFVKPSKTNISHAAMKKCNNMNDLVKAYTPASEISDNNIANIEEYLIGQDLASIDYVFDEEVIHILTIGEISTGEPGFDGVGWYSCSKNGKEDKLLQKRFIEIKEKLNIRNGFFQSAMKVNLKKEEAKVYEIHAEIGGDLVNDIFIPNITNNYNIFMNNILLSLNKKPEYCNDEIKPSVILFKKKIKQYNFSYESPLVESRIADEDYIILFFHNYLIMQNYLENMSSQKFFSTMTY